MRDSIPPFLGLFLGCPVVRSLSWCGRRKKEGQEGRTDIRQLICGNPWQWSHPLIHSLCFSNHSLLRKTLKSIFFRLCFVKLKLLLLAIEVSQTILVRSSFLTEAKAPFVLRHSPFIFMNCNCSENHSFAITSFTLIARWSQTMAATQRFQSTLDEARWKIMNKNQTSTRQCDTIFTLFSFNFHKIPPPAISTPIQCYVFAKVPANTIGFFIAQSAEEVKRWDFP